MKTKLIFLITLTLGFFITKSQTITTTLTNSENATIKSLYPNTNYSFSPFLEPETYNISNTWHTNQSLLKFNLSGLQNTNNLPLYEISISSAVLKLYDKATNNNGNGIINLITSTWDVNNVTYNNKPNISTEFNFYIQSNPIVNVTAIVNNWINNAMPNYGFIITMYNDWMMPYSSSLKYGAYTNPPKPELVITYNLSNPKYDGPWYVSTTGNDNYGNGSLTKPFKTIQRAINICSNASVTNKTIYVAQGTYNENLTWSFDGIKLYSISNNPDNTIISGITSPLSPVINFTTGNNVSYNTIIKGFKIQNGRFGIYMENAYPVLENLKICNNGSHSLQACGIYSSFSAFNSNNKSYIKNVEIYNNYSNSPGAGIHSNKSKLIIEDSKIYNNSKYGTHGSPTSLYGGGIYSENSEIDLNQVDIDSNSLNAHFNYNVRLFGAGIYAVNSKVNMINSKITNNKLSNTMACNESIYIGAGVYLYNTKINISNTTFSNNKFDILSNSSSVYGPAIFLHYNNDLSISNSIFWNHQGKDIYCDVGASNTIRIDHSNYEGGSYDLYAPGNNQLYWGLGNINSNPLFIGDYNYRLQSTSPCISMGIETGAPNVDRDGNPRMTNGSNPDMGAYENAASNFAELFIPRSAQDANGAEPYSGSASELYDSPNIWLRQANDNGTVHQNPVYTGTNPNYVYVKIQNKTNIPSRSGTVELYYTMVRTGQTWPTQWDYSLTTNGDGVHPYGSAIATINVGPIEANESVTKVVGWYPPNPIWYDAYEITYVSGKPAIGFLARLQTPDDPIPTTANVTGPVVNNIIQSNNIALKNKYIISLVPNKDGGLSFTPCNPCKFSIILEDLSISSDGLFKDLGEVKVRLGAALYEKWAGEGNKGYNIQPLPDEYSIKLLGDNATITDLGNDANTEQVKVVFALKKESNPMQDYSYEYRVVVQNDDETIPSEVYNFTLEVHKAENLMAVITDSTLTSCSGYNDGSATVTAYGGTPPYTYSWAYDAGSQTTATATNLYEGYYDVTVTDSEGNITNASANIKANPALFDYNSGDTLTADMQWNSLNYKIENVINVPDGITLNITNSDIEFGSNGGIKVERGGKLIIDNSHIHGLGSCGNMWGGISAIGAYGTPQPEGDPVSQPLLQAFVWLKNNSVIENAHRAIFSGDPFSRDTRSGSGAIIWVESGSSFVNCYLSVEFNGYNLNNRSHFENCSFVCNSPLSHRLYGGGGPRWFVRSWGNNGLTFNNVSFSNTANFPTTERGTAFNSLTPLNNGRFTNCSFTGLTSGLTGIYYSNSINNCTFTNMKQGIVLNQFVNQLGNNVIDDNTFNNVQKAVYIQGGYLDDITHNTFNDIAMANDDDAYGVFMVGSGAFNIASNTFNGIISEFPLKYGSFGIVSENSGNLGGVIFDNYFDNCDYGIQTQDDNNYLSIRCNSFNNIGTYGLMVYNGRLMQQGADCSNTSLVNADALAAGNEWYGTCSGENNIYVAPEVTFTYYAQNRAVDNSKSTVPSCSSTWWSEKYLQVCSIKKTATSCSSFIPGLPPAPPATAYEQYIDAIELLIYENQIAKDELNAEKENIIAITDGGNSRLLISTVNNTSNGAQLKNILLAAMPLSDAVLLAVINKTPALAHGLLKEIITASSPVSDEVMLALTNLNPALPQGTLNVINNAQANESLYPKPEAIDREIAYYDGNNQLLENEYIRMKLKNNSSQEVVEILENSDKLISKKVLTENYMSKELVTESLAKLSEVVAESPILETDETANFEKLINSLAVTKEQGKTIYEMDAATELIVREAADAGKIVSAKAENVLMLAKDENRMHPVRKGMTNKSMKINSSNNEVSKVIEIESSEFTESYFNIYPNPSNGNFEVDMSNDGNLQLEIYDILGKVVSLYKFGENCKHAFINNSEMDAGIYNYRVFSGNNEIVNGKLIIVK